MAVLKCKKCDCTYFTPLRVNQFNDMSMDVNSGYRALNADEWKVYMCLNPKCRQVIMPEMTSLTIPKKDMRHIEEMASALNGEPKQVPEVGRMMPRPGEILPR
jgi:hypothetical protein